MDVMHTTPEPAWTQPTLGYGQPERRQERMSASSHSESTAHHRSRRVDTRVPHHRRAGPPARVTVTSLVTAAAHLSSTMRHFALLPIQPFK
jgi:hypothetical protein